MSRQSIEDFSGSETILYDSITVDMLLYIHQSIECTIPRVKPNVHYGLWVVTVCHYTVTDCKKHTSLMWNVHSGEAVQCRGRGHGETLCTFCSIYYEHENCS